MRTAAFVLFAVVTATAAALSTLVGSRYVNLEKDLADTRFQLEESLRDRRRLEEEKSALRQERERVQADLEARFSEQRSQLEECSNKRQQDLQELLVNIYNLQKRVSDLEGQIAYVSSSEKVRLGQEGKEAAAQAPAPPAPSGNTGPLPAKNTDVPKGAIPTREQEAQSLNKAQ